MTTGRINQVAFLDDAGAARGRRAASRGDDGGRSMRAIDAEFGQERRRGAPPALLVFRIRELRHVRPWAEARPFGRGSEHGLAFAVHPAPRRPAGGQAAPGERLAL